MPISTGVAAMSFGQAPNNTSSPLSQREDAAEKQAQALRNTSAQRPGVGTGASAMTAQAVKATPASAPAVKVDFGSEGMPEEIHYPVTGPDKFAKAVAVESQVAFEAVEDVPEPTAPEESVKAKAKAEASAPPPAPIAAPAVEVQKAPEASPGARPDDLERPESATEYAARTEASAPKED